MSVSLVFWRPFCLLWRAFHIALTPLKWLISRHNGQNASITVLTSRLPPAKISPHAQEQSQAFHKEPDYRSQNAIGMDYRPPVVEVLHHSKNAIVARLEPGIVLKYPRYAWWDYPNAENEHQAVRESKTSFIVEEAVLKALGDHPRIVKFLGTSYDPRGLKFAQANRGNLQQYLDRHYNELCPTTQARWCLQAIESIAFIHSKGVMHSDLRPENFLLYSQPNGQVDLRLCDFGGSTYKNLSGGHLPDSGFFDPRKEWATTEATDIFSLGSVLFTIMAGHWPHWIAGEECQAYMDRVDELFLRSDFPPVDQLQGGFIIYGCWMDKYHRASDVLEDYQSLTREGPA